MKTRISISLSNNTILVIFIILTIVILGLEFLLYQFERNRLIDEEQLLLRNIAEKEEKNVSEWYVNTKNFTEVITQSELFRTYFNNYIKNPSELRAFKSLNEFFKNIIIDKNLVDVIIYDSTFKKIYSYQDFGYNLTDELHEKILQFDSENYFYISRIYKRKSPFYQNIIPVIDIVSGIKNNSETVRPNYYMILVADARKNIFPLINTISNMKNTLETMLIAERNNQLIYLNDLRFLFSSEIVLKSSSGSEDIPGKKLNISKKGLIEGVDYRGEKVFAYITYIPLLDWFLVTKIDKREILIKTNKVLYTISGSIILILFLFIVVLGVLWKREEVEKIKKELEIQKIQNLLSQKYQIVSKYANDAFFLISKDGSIVEANDKAIEMYGYSINEFKGRPFILLEAPEYRMEWNELIKKLRQDSGSVYESIHINRHGNKFFVEISAKIISIQDELFLVAIVRNIEDRKKAELQLVESERKFHTLFEHAYDSILLIKKDIIIDCNPRAGELFHTIREDLIHKKITEFIAENNQELVEEFLDTLRKNSRNESKSFILTLKKTNGEIFDGEINLSFFELKGEKVAQVVIRDVTEKQRFLEHLEKFKRAIENTEEMMMITDKEGRIEYVNPAFEKITGYKLEEIQGKTPRILKSGYHPDEFYKNLWETILSGKSWSGLIVNRKRDGREYTEEMLISPIKNEKNEIISFVAVKKDVTERIKAEEELRKARLKAEESERIKSNFLSMMSHEVRTPLNVILGFIDILKNAIDSEEFPEKEHIFSVIQRNSKRLINLINDIIDISRIESDELKLNFDIHNVKNLIEKVLEEYEVEARNKGLELIKESDSEDIYIKVDEIRFKQILSNLLSNAIKFTSKGTVTVSTKVSDNKVYILVKDTGIGIPKEFIPHLFEFFRQAEEGYNRNFEGAGLGLAITKKLVTMMNGEIYVESEQNIGSTFTIIFPLVKEFKVEQKVEEEIEYRFEEEKVIESTEPTILIVEDNKDNSYFVEVILSKLGLKYYSVEKSEEAVEILKQQPIDLILMDISLAGGMSGEEAFRLIRRNEKYNHIPIIAMTAHAMMGDREYFLKVGFDDYLAKPFTFEQLTNLLFKYLKR